MMLGVELLHLLPHALLEAPDAIHAVFLWVLAGFLVMFSPSGSSAFTTTKSRRVARMRRTTTRLKPAPTSAASPTR